MLSGNGVYRHYIMNIYSFSVGTVFGRQNKDTPRAERVKVIFINDFSNPVLFAVYKLGPIWK